jgi:hypothetical protein
MALTIHAHLSTRLKKEYNYTFTPTMRLYGLLYGEFQLKNLPVFIPGALIFLFFHLYRGLLSDLLREISDRAYLNE